MRELTDLEIELIIWLWIGVFSLGTAGFAAADNYLASLICFLLIVPGAFILLVTLFKIGGEYTVKVKVT